MKAKLILILLLTSCFAALLHGQTPNAGRTFSYQASDSIASSIDPSRATTLNSKTTIEVKPYLYLSGTIGANWVVSGWGVGSNTQSSRLQIFHDETISILLAGFDNPLKSTGTKNGKQTVDMRGQLRLWSGISGALLVDTGLVNAPDLNGLGLAEFKAIDPGMTGGLSILELSRTIDLTPDDGPGVYTNIGTISISRN